MPDVTHFQDCDDLALGRYVRDRADDFGLDTGALGIVASQAIYRAPGYDLAFWRTGCQCASLRASAAATYHGKLRKAAAAKGGQ